MNFTEIGRIHTPFKQAAGTPLQPSRADGAEGTIHIHPEFADGLSDLAGFDRIWLLFWFDRAIPAKLKVIPYLDTVERGIFATRGPARPSAIGLSNVRLLGIEKNILRIADVDILDNTPLIDIKPFVPSFDVYPVQRVGWFDAALNKKVVADGRFEKKRS